MAEPLSSERPGPNLTRATFKEFDGRYDDIEDELINAQETVRSIRKRRKDLRGVMVASGIVIAEFDRYRHDIKRSGEEREAADLAYRQYMAYGNKPIGFQGSVVFEGELAPRFTPAELKRIENAGCKDGKAGNDSSRNTYTPGTEAFASFHTGWVRGQGEKVATEIGKSEPPKRKRGRPPNAERQVRGGIAPVPVVAPPDGEARQRGYADGLGDFHDHAGRYPQGNPGHGDYMIGRAEGARKREENGEPLPLGNGADAGESTPPVEQSAGEDGEKMLS